MKLKQILNFIITTGIFWLAAKLFPQQVQIASWTTLLIISTLFYVIQTVVIMVGVVAALSTMIYEVDLAERLTRIIVGIISTVTIMGTAILLVASGGINGFAVSGIGAAITLALSTMIYGDDFAERLIRIIVGIIGAATIMGAAILLVASEGINGFAVSGIGAAMTLSLVATLSTVRVQFTHDSDRD